MATKPLCSIPDCGKPHFGHGFCNTHYLRWKKCGDPLGAAVRKLTKVQRFFQDVVLTYEGDECLIWPYARVGTGYGHMFHDGKTALVHRRVCEFVNGKPPTADHQAAHSCGKGRDGCCTKRHLSWKTQVENELDKVAHGTKIFGEKQWAALVTEEQARQILSLKGTQTQREIAGQFGVSDDLVGQIHRRTRWAWLTDATSAGPKPS